MTRKSVVSMFLLLTMLVTSVGAVGAATPGNGDSWVSGFFVTNKETSAAANVNMKFYKTAVAVAAYDLDKTVAAGDTTFFYLGSGGNLNEEVTDDGEYSVVLASDQPIVAVVNSTSSNAGQSTTSFDGVSAPSAKLFAPNIYSDYYGYATNFYLQNAGAVDTDVTIKYFDATGAEIAALADTQTILAGSFVKVDQTGVTDLLVDTVCSATFECTGTDCKLAGIVNIVNIDTAIGTANYVMYSAGSQVAYAPVVLNDYYKFNSSINIQNNGTGAVDVKITFSDNTVVTATKLGEGQATSYYLPGITGLATGNAEGALAAKVEVISPVTGNAIVVLVNTSSTGDASFASYNGVTAGAQTVYAPAANAMAYNTDPKLGYFTSVTCQNLSDTATDLTYTWSGQDTASGYVAVSGSGKKSDIDGETLAGGAAFVLLPNTAAHRTGIDNMPAGFNGAIVITADENISCIVNQNLAGGSSNQDNLGSYTGRP